MDLALVSCSKSVSALYCQDAGEFSQNSPADWKILSGEPISGIDILNMSCALSAVSEFFDVQAAAIAQNNTILGAALGKTADEAFLQAIDADPVSAQGAFVAVSKNVSVELAKLVISTNVGSIVATDFDKDALSLLLSNKKINVIHLKTSLEKFRKLLLEDVRITPFGAIISDVNDCELTKDNFKIVTKEKPSTELIEDAIFGWKVSKYVKANAAVVVKNFKTQAIAQGYANLCNATEDALDIACDNSKDAVLIIGVAAKTVDVINAAAQGRISLIIQPGGTACDKQIIEACDKFKISMIMTDLTINKV